MQLADLKNEISLVIIKELFNKEIAAGRLTGGTLNKMQQINWSARANHGLELGIPSGKQKNLDVFQTVQTASETAEHFHRWSSCKYMD